jgi:hypothetical protein
VVLSDGICRGLLAVAIIFIGVAGAQARYRYITDRRRGRRFYWTTSTAGILCMTTGVGRLWPNGVIAAAFFGALAVGMAYLATPYLKIGDRIHAFTIANQRPDPPADGSEPTPPPPPPADSYSGTVTARNMWWCTAVCACCLTAFVYLFGWGNPLWGAIILGVAGCCGLGIRDARDGFDIARRQRIPFAVASVASLIFFGVFPVAYLSAYAIGARWPARHSRHHREQGRCANLIPTVSRKATRSSG